MVGRSPGDGDPAEYGCAQECAEAHGAPIEGLQRCGCAIRAAPASTVSCEGAMDLVLCAAVSYGTCPHIGCSFVEEDPIKVTDCCHGTLWISCAWCERNMMAA